MVKLWTFASLIPMVVLALSVQQATSTSSSEVISDVSATNVILVGALGDLSKKYLWQGLFDLYLAEETTHHKLNFFAVGRKSVEEGTPILTQILDDRVKCKESPDASSSCNRRLQVFKSSVEYKQLKKAEDYAEFCVTMVNEIGGAKENGRLFYLSVPPFAYAGIAENIHKGCRPPADTWLRVVLEKPFGHDLQSARELANQLSGFLKDEEIYRIDHYLGKIGVQSILPFRHLNKAKYERLWNRDHIARVEIVMKEAIDVKGRLEFYDSYGVIRDVMQNHLTEIMALIGMETPRNISDHQETLANKLRFLHQVQPINAKRAVIGQYDEYASQWQDELEKSADERVHTPTFAGVALYVNNPRWMDIPFVMTAGKALDERIGYVRVLFHDNSVCMKMRTSNHLGQCDMKQIIFLTGNPGLKYPSVLISKNLPEPEMPSPWTKSSGYSKDLEFLGFSLSDFHHFSQSEEVSAYTALISSCFHGNKEKFVGTQDLMASWGIWTPLLDDLVGKAPRIYPSGNTCGDWLDFQVSHHKKLYYLNDIDDEWEVNNQAGFSTMNMATISDTYRSHPLVTGTKDEVVERLAVHLRNIAGESIRERGAFHLALSGGKTPKHLLAYLALRMNLDFPWHQIHIWLVDERCTSSTDERSNYRMLYSSLLKYIQIPHTNVHPMPVELPNGFCNSADRGAVIYESELMRTIPSGRLDYVLLGMGADGHTASLFPSHSSLDYTESLVLVTDGGPPDEIPHRMTLSFSAINTARHAGVLVVGKTKRQMVSLLKSEGVDNRTKYPVTGVQLTDGDLVWYIDHKALI